jgi:hypothetical protein
MELNEHTAHKKYLRFFGRASQASGLGANHDNGCPKHEKLNSEFKKLISDLRCSYLKSIDTVITKL